MLFSEIGLTAELLRAVKDQGYTEATPVQAKAIPLVLEGNDVLAGAQTGTGKTAGFVLPLLQRLQMSPPKGRFSRVRVLILTPTRELAAQVAESVRIYGRHLPFKAAVIFGGVGIRPQMAKLRKGVDIVVATPGRLLDHMQQGTIRLDAVDTLVLDEADRMLDMGFIRDIRKILKALPTERQNLLFSATFSHEIRQLAGELLNQPVEVQVARRNTAAELVSQVVHPVDRARKRDLLAHLIGTGNWRQVLVFTRTKHGANRLSQQLGRDGLSSTAIHGNKSQAARTRALADFKSGRVRILVATDVAARGLDIERLPYVVNYELPHVSEDYVHRIGRTGRAGQDGKAVSLVCVDERKLLHGIERLLKRDIERVFIPGYEPDASIRPEPIFTGRQNQGGGKRHGGGPPRGRRPGAAQGGRPGGPSGPRRQGRPAGDRRQDDQGYGAPRRAPAGDRRHGAAADGRRHGGPGDGPRHGRPGQPGRPGAAKGGGRPHGPSGGGPSKGNSGRPHGPASGGRSHGPSGGGRSNAPAGGGRSHGPSGGGRSNAPAGGGRPGGNQPRRRRPSGPGGGRPGSPAGGGPSGRRPSGRRRTG